MVDTNLSEINDLQTAIMVLIRDWARKEKVPIPRRIVISEMGKFGVKSFTVINALRSLKYKGYIRKAVTVSNTTSFVMLRSL